MFGTVVSLIGIEIVMSHVGQYVSVLSKNVHQMPWPTTVDKTVIANYGVFLQISYAGEVQATIVIVS